MIQILTYNNYFFLSLILLNVVIINILLTKVKKTKLMDLPNEKRKIHKIPIPKIGGIILIINFIFYLNFVAELENPYIITFLTILIFLVGFIDDIYNLKPLTRIILIILFFYIFLNQDQFYVINNIYFESYDLTLNTGKFDIILTILCFLLIINAFNLFDGLNGLSIGYFLFIFSYILIKFNLENLTMIVIICSFLFFYNIRSKIFLGDSGIYILTTFLGLQIISINNNQLLNFSAENIFLILMIPGLDMFRLFIERSMNLKSFFLADNNHLHHYLYRKLGHKITLLVLFALLIIPISLYEMQIIHSYYIIFINFILYSILIVYLKYENKS